jgi:hypothetical protein
LFEEVEEILTSQIQEIGAIMVVNNKNTRLEAVQEELSAAKEMVKQCIDVYYKDDFIIQ